MANVHVEIHKDCYIYRSSGGGTAVKKTLDDDDDDDDEEVEKGKN